MKLKKLILYSGVTLFVLFVLDFFSSFFIEGTDPVIITYLIILLYSIFESGNPITAIYILAKILALAFIILIITFFIIKLIVRKKEKIKSVWSKIIKFNGLVGIFMGVILMLFVPIGWGFNIGAGAIIILISAITFIVELIRKKEPRSRYKVRLAGIIGILIGLIILYLLTKQPMIKEGHGIIIIYISFLILFIDIVVDIIKGFLKKRIR
jgi:hypothetical protein